MNSRMAQKALQVVSVANVALKRAMDELAQHQAAQRSARAKQATALQQLLKSQLIDAAQEKEARDMLARHDQTLELLSAAVDKAVEFRGAQSKQAASLGRAQPREDGALGTNPFDRSPGVTAYDSLRSNYLGAKTSLKKASDLAYERALLGS